MRLTSFRSRRKSILDQSLRPPHAIRARFTEATRASRRELARVIRRKSSASRRLRVLSRPLAADADFPRKIRFPWSAVDDIRDPRSVAPAITMGNLSRLIGKKFTGTPRFAIADIIARKAASHAARRNELTARLAARLRARVAIIAIVDRGYGGYGGSDWYNKCRRARHFPPPPSPGTTGDRCFRAGKRRMGSTSRVIAN